MMAEAGQEGKRTSEKERVRFKSFRDFTTRTGCRPRFPGLLSAGMTSAGVTFFRGHDGSGGLKPRVRESSFPRKRESRNRLGSETEGCFKN